MAFSVDVAPCLPDSTDNALDEMIAAAGHSMGMPAALAIA
jgi:hypothetical protein